MNDEGSGFGVVERTGAVAKAKGKEAEDGDVLEEALKEAGIDWTDLGEGTKDRKKWKRLFTDRMEALAKWDMSKGKLWSGGVVERNGVRGIMGSELVCKVCVS